MRHEDQAVQKAVISMPRHPRKNLEDVPQLRPKDIRSADVLASVRSLNLDAIFAMCIDTYLPRDLIAAPRYGSYLWHEGMVPEYRGVYPVFWALAQRDFGSVGYTLLRMNDIIDGGERFIEGRVKGVDLARDWHGYIAHKSILESLPETEAFLERLENGTAEPLVRSEGVDHMYSYPTFSALARIWAWRVWRRMTGKAKTGVLQH